MKKRRLLMVDDFWCKTIFARGWHFMGENLWWEATIDRSRPVGLHSLSRTLVWQCHFWFLLQTLHIHLLIHILLKYHIINLRWCHDFLITLVENFSNEKKLLNIALGEVSYLRTYYNRVVIYREKTIIKITRCWGNVWSKKVLKRAHLRETP